MQLRLSADMTTLKINQQEIEVTPGTTILSAAKLAGVEIPTLCFLEGCQTFTSCMLCVVEDITSGKLLPACTASAENGMEIECNNDRVKGARQDTLNMLLSEHVGDCEAPCTRGCPAHMDIPLMIRLIAEGELETAIQVVKRDIALPAVLGRICPAPCEAVCNRDKLDHAVSICLLKRFVADLDLNKETPFRPEVKPLSGKSVAVVGGGPAGLSAAYYMIQQGHAVTLFEKEQLAGGQLRTAIDDKILPKTVLDQEIEQILLLGVELRNGMLLGRDIHLETLRQEFDAVVLTIGSAGDTDLSGSEIEVGTKGIVADRKTFESTLPGVFAGGNSIGESKRAIRSLAHGKSIAFSINQMLNGEAVKGETRVFDSRMGKVSESELGEFNKEVKNFTRFEKNQSTDPGMKADDAAQESARCFHCDCRKPNTCLLRRFADEYDANQTQFKTGTRKPFKRIMEHESVVYEPGKCIKCATCIRITEREKETFGLSFSGRGFDVEVTVPFSESVAAALKVSARACVEACPTGALAFKEGGDESN